MPKDHQSRQFKDRLVLPEKELQESLRRRLGRRESLHNPQKCALCSGVSTGHLLAALGLDLIFDAPLTATRSVTAVKIMQGVARYVGREWETNKFLIASSFASRLTRSYKISGEHPAAEQDGITTCYPANRMQYLVRVSRPVTHPSHSNLTFQAMFAACCGNAIDRYVATSTGLGVRSRFCNRLIGLASALKLGLWLHRRLHPLLHPQLPVLKK